MKKLIAVAADYHRTPLGTWTAILDALLDADDEDGLSANAAGATLAACQERVLELVAELSTRAGRPCHTLHLLDGDATAFIQAYRAEVGFAGWSASR
jgi:hypothetical protein